MPVTPPTIIDYIEIDDTGPLWDWCCIPDVAWLGGMALRDFDVIVPHAPGVYSFDPVIGALQGDLLGYFDGRFDTDGNAVTGESAVWAQLEDNRDFFIDEVVRPPGGDGTRTLTLHTLGGSTRSGAIKVVGGLKVGGEAPGTLNFALTIKLVDGELVTAS